MTEEEEGGILVIQVSDYPIGIASYDLTEEQVLKLLERW